MKYFTFVVVLLIGGSLLLFKTPIGADEKESGQSGQAEPEPATEATMPTANSNRANRPSINNSRLTTEPIFPTPDQPDLDHRVAHIIKGQQASDGQFPWMAMLMRDGGGEVFCSGSLIDSNWVLTAGHCLAIANIGDDVYIATGNGGELRDITGSVSHDSADIGLLELDQPQLAQTISLGSTSVPSSAVIIGFGQDEKLNRGTLSYAFANVVASTACAGIESSSDRLCVTDDTSGICFGDSGGPLVDGSGQGARLIGVAAEIDHTIGCGPNPIGLRLGSFTRIADYSGWIDENTTLTATPSAPTRPIIGAQ